MKPGDEYQEIVGAVQAALDPGATVKVGSWIVGPDGRRDLDVEVRGTLDGEPFLALVECKDWRKKVGIEVVDALDSKRTDLHAQRAMIFSNSGFTKPALRKAARLGIDMSSALRAGDQRIRVEVHGEQLAKGLRVQTVNVVMFPPPNKAHQIPDGWGLGGLSYAGAPVQNWLAAKSLEWLRQYEPHGSLTFKCTFKPDSLWTYEGQQILVGAVVVTMKCERQWLYQSVRKDVSLGLYDHLKKVVAIPSKEWFSMGTIDQEAWKPYEGEPTRKVLEPNSLEIHLVLLAPLVSLYGQGIPDLDSIVVERQLSLEGKILEEHLVTPATSDGMGA